MRTMTATTVRLFEMGAQHWSVKSMPCVDLVEAIMAIEHECEQRSAVVRGNYLVIVTVVTIIPITITTGTMNSTSLLSY